MKYLFANWKMYLDTKESVEVFSNLKNNVVADPNVQLGIFPSTLAVSQIIGLAQNTPFVVGAQNVAWVPKGAYTGAVSALLFKEAGCEYALVGHSERRHIFHETDEAVHDKINACLDVGLTPIVCIGETKEDLENDKREYRLKKQIMKAFSNLENANGKKIIIAYEPVWAIGTSEPCDPALAAEIHNLIRSEVKNYLPDCEISVIYGGSVDKENMLSYLTMPPIDGVLVGSASIHGEDFIQMIKAASQV